MIAVGSDHGGFSLKQAIMKQLDEQNIAYKDFGTYTEESCDYPVYAEKVCRAILSGECEKGLLFCGTGIGIGMAANKVRGIRAATCSDIFSARYSRLHNDANVLCLGGRVVGPGLAGELVDAFLTTEFEGGRHSRRVALISDIEKRESGRA